MLHCIQLTTNCHIEASKAVHACTLVSKVLKGKLGQPAQHWCTAETEEHHGKGTSVGPIVRKSWWVNCDMASPQLHWHRCYGCAMHFPLQ